MPMIEIIDTDYDLVHFRVADKATADAVVEWAKKAYPEAKIRMQEMDDYVGCVANTRTGAPGKHRFEEAFSKALRAYITSLG